MDYSRFKDAKYPCAGTRTKLRLKYRKEQGVEPHSKEDTAFFEGVYSAVRACDPYLFKQYHLRDKAVKILEDGGDPQKAIAILKEIGS